VTGLLLKIVASREILSSCAAGCRISAIAHHVLSFPQLSLGSPEQWLLPTDLMCVTASGQSVEIIGEVKVGLRYTTFMALNNVLPFSLFLCLISM
jgi:hypothetical protein